MKEAIEKAYQALGQNYDSMFSLLSAYLLRQGDSCTIIKDTPSNQKRRILSFFYLLNNPGECVSSMPEKYNIDPQHAETVYATLHGMLLDAVSEAYKEKRKEIEATKGNGTDH